MAQPIGVDSSLLRRFAPLSLRDIAVLPPPNWLIEGVLPTDALVVLYGEPGIGKSFLALDWAFSIAMGLPWQGRETRRGSVVYIYAEGRSGLSPRTKAWIEQHGVAPLEFRVVPVPVTVPDENHRKAFVSAVKNAGIQSPALVVVDTLARNFGPGNESLAQDMNQFVAGCDALREAFAETTVLAVHHSGKMQKRGARGSLALQAAANSVFALVRAGDGMKLISEKQKDGDMIEPIHLGLADICLPDGGTSCVIGASKPGAVPHATDDPRTKETDILMLSALQRFGSAGARAGEWFRAAKDDRPSLAKDTFYKSRGRLVEASRVRVIAERYFVVEPTNGPGPETVDNVVQFDRGKKSSS